MVQKAGLFLLGGLVAATVSAPAVVFAQAAPASSPQKATTTTGTVLSSRPPKDRAPVIRFRTPEEGSVGWHDLVKGPIAFPNSELDEEGRLKSADAEEKPPRRGRPPRA